MSAIIPIFISPDRQQWIIALPSEVSACYICSSTKLRNAIKQAFEKDSITDASVLHFKEVANMIIKSVKKVAGQELEAIRFTDDDGKFLTVSRTSCEHNFEPTPVVESEPESRPVSRRPLDKSLLKRRAEIRARLQKLAE